MWPVLKSIQPALEDRDMINRKEWNAICAIRVTTSRRQASHYWEILTTFGVFRPINGTTWKIDHDALIKALIQCNHESGADDASEGST
jgi:hypothetical protein